MLKCCKASKHTHGFKNQIKGLGTTATEKVDGASTVVSMPASKYRKEKHGEIFCLDNP